MAEQAKSALNAETLDVVADRGYYSGEEIVACEVTGISVCLPKPATSNAKADGRFDKQDFVYVAQNDVYRCPAGEQLIYRHTREEDGKNLRAGLRTVRAALSHSPRIGDFRGAQRCHRVP